MSRPWAELYPPGVTSDLAATDKTMRDAWDRHVRDRPDAPALHYFDQTLTYSEVERVATSLAAGLLEAGIGAGDRVAIYLQNDPQWVVGMLAAWKLGAIPVAVNPMLRHQELTHHLVDSGPRVLICLNDLYADVVAGVLPSTSVEQVITTHPLDLTCDASVPEGLRTTLTATEPVVDQKSVNRDGATVRHLAWADLIEQHRHAVVQPVELTADAVGLLTYTSGTTGRSKGAMNLHGAMAHSSTVYAKWWDLHPGQDAILGLAPVFHITGAIAGVGAHLVSGAPLILLHRFDADATLAAIEQWRASFVVGASTAFIALSNHPALDSYDVSSLTKTPSGGAPVGEALVERVASATGWELHGAYGMTETNSPTHLGPPQVTPPVDPDSGALAVGIPVPGAEVRIVDVDTGDDVPPGTAGEIVVRGPMVIPGYWHMPDETAATIRDGWLHTGDVGKETDDGWLFVVDRLKDLINAGGYKVYPRDVEDVLYEHSAVREACVVGAADEYRGETVVAYVSLVAGAAVEPDELIDFCRERMSAYKYPRQVHILDELPKTATGKVLRRELRA